jgi:peroxiredoxin
MLGNDQDSKERTMSKINGRFLDVNDPFPEFSVKLATGKTLSLPHGKGEGYGVILFYRGAW